jgi:hypothetical protein
VNTCGCACHGAGPYGACDVEGGCGSAGCDYDIDHRCARGDHCQDREPVRDTDGRHTGTWLPRRIDVERGLCDTCTRTVEHALHHLTGDVVELSMLIGRSGTLTETIVTSTRDLPIPISVTLEALRAEIDTELQAWAEPVAEQLNVEWDTAAMGHTRMAVRVQRAAQLLANAVDTLLALDPQEHPAWEHGEPVRAPEFLPDHVQDTVIRDGVDGALALLHLHRLAYSAAGRTELVHRLPTPCPWCDFRALVRHNGSSEVTCENCRRHIEERHYSWFVSVLVELETRRQQEAMSA